jgi:hypothetical protein
MKGGGSHTQKGRVRMCRVRVRVRVRVKGSSLYHAVFQGEEHSAHALDRSVL